MVHHFCRIAIAVLLGFCFLICPPSSASADDPEVTITVTAFIVGTLGGFTITYINDYEVELNWVKGDKVENTMVRAAVGYEPVTRDDGFLVYYGSGEQAEAMLDLTGDNTYFFKLWAQNEDGIWNEVDTISGQAEGIGMVFIALVLLALGLTVIGFWQKRIVMMLAAGMAWFGIGMFGLVVRAAGAGDVLFVVGWLGIGLTLVCFMATAWLKEKREPLETPLSGEDAHMEEMRAMLDKHRETRRRIRESR